MKKIVILLFAVLAQAVCVFGEELARELARECAKGGMVVLPDASHARIKTAFEKRIAEIRGTANMSVPEGAECRYLSGKGDDAADGKTPATAWRTTERLDKESLAPGSFVLFERGGVYRGGFRASKGVTYTAYGKGAKPCIYSSPENGADSAKWERTEAPNVWRYKIGKKDVGTIVFDGGAAHAIKIIPVYNDDGTYTQQYGGRPFNNGYKDLACDLHFWHDYSEKTDFKPFSKGTGYLYLYSARNPGERFKSIEFNVKKHGVAVGGANDVHIDNLCIMYVGSHGVGAGTVKGLRVTNCEFGWIGGSIQAERIFRRKWATRYGNAVEIWGGCDGFTVDNCYVHDVYDAGLTQQFNVEKPDEASDQRHVRYSRNVIENCNYSVEYFLAMKGEARVSNPSRMEDFAIEGNLMRNAGRGFCQQRPDHSQAAHIKSWRNGANRATGYVIRDNVFAFGDEMLVEISSGLANPDGSDSMPEMKGNVFIGREGQRFGVLNQGKPVELKYDRKLAAALGARYSGNVFALAAAAAANVSAKVKSIQIAAGLIGQPFICPDMVGGGDWVAFIPGSPFEQELFIRSAQIHALCPMMQISASPWRVLDERHQAIFRDILALRQKFAPMIAALAKKAGEDGEPILRSLEYAYPGRGYAGVIDEFMMGDDLLVAPVMKKGATYRKVVLPPGKWKADDGQVYDGPAAIEVAAPLSRIPHFERQSAAGASLAHIVKPKLP